MDRERAHLRASRAALRAMREDAESLDLTDTAATWVSAEALRAQVQLRIAALADLADTPLFFGRIDLAHDDATDDRPQHERFYIGRRHVHDAEGDPLVLDWRAPVSQSFYQATRERPMDVALRRRFGWTRGELTAYEDEHLTDPHEMATTSALLTAEIERPRVGPMRDIVATIQPDQDVLVRRPLSGTVCVQGGPGTGKTAVGLHRVAYLLYTHRERLRRTGTLVVGPNRSFLRYIEQVLPALGEVRVGQATVDELVAHVPVRAVDTPAAALVKGDARMAEVLRRAVWSGVVEPTESLVVVRGSRRWRVPAHELVEVVAELRSRGVRYGAARQALAQRIAHTVLLRMEAAGEAPDDRVQDAVARSREVKDLVKRLWPVVEPAKVVMRLLGEPEFLAECARDLLSEEEQAAIRWPKPARGVRSAPWTAADAVLVDEATDLVERIGALGHVVLDEAQDLSPMQYRAVGRRCSTGSATVLGDLAQGTTPWATSTWEEALRHLGQEDGVVEELTQGFRVPEEVIAFASRLLPAIAPGLAPATSVRRSPGALRVVRAPLEETTAATVRACRTALENEGSIGLIAADARLPELAAALAEAGLDHLEPGRETSAECRLTLVPASLAKGLEYDWVVVHEPAAVVAGEPDRRTGLRRLYVVLTRPVSGLLVVHGEDLPEELAERPRP
ncbi:HelD family protein [Allostreptomyces psammosilenae]|uniref:HelD family protein n=1 Tax=Allostreptomyces psammosilenae TaxID=1892865 RepID=UPI001FE31F51|nr:AAA family ATPase [Allostreptomyces psammosilenae]